MKVTLCASILALLAACASSSSTNEPPTERVNQSDARGEVFWTAFNAGRYEDISKVQDALAREMKSERTGYLERLMGVTYFWTAAEAERNPSVDMASNAFAALEHLGEAKRLAPEDPWVPCFLGLMDYFVGDAVKDDSRKQRALRELDRGIAAYPEFNTYCRALVRAQYPRGSQELAMAVDDLWTIIRMCSDVTPEHPTTNDSAPMERCTQRPRVPHGYNGFWLTAGDVLSKANEPTIARAFYQNAKLAHLSDWSFRDMLEQRILKLEENTRLYSDADPTNDPPLAFQTQHACVMCHAR